MRDYLIKRLARSELGYGLDLFARAMVRDWPCSENQVFRWVHKEFYPPRAVSFGAFSDEALWGIICCVPFEFVFGQLLAPEAKLLLEAIREIFPDLVLPQIIHIGGLGAEK